MAQLPQRPEIQRVTHDLECVCWSPKQIHRMTVQGQCFESFFLMPASVCFATGFLPAFSKVTGRQADTTRKHNFQAHLPS